MFDLKAYKERFNDSGWRVLERALEETRRRVQNYISLEHILQSLAEEEVDLFNAVLHDLAISPREFKTLIEKRLDSSLQYQGEGIRIAPETTNLFKRARERARGNGRQRIDATDLFIALSQDVKGLFIEMMRSFGAEPEAAVESVRSHVRMKEAVRARIRTEKQQHEMIGQTVRIKSGPFASFTGRVEEISEDDLLLTVRVDIFGRSHPIQLRFDDVEVVTFQ